MKFPSSRFLVFTIAAILFIAQSVSAQVVEIPDPNLEKAIRAELQHPQRQPITQQDMEQLTRLSAWHSNIVDLTGIQHAIYLNHLALRYNQIQDLTPIADLIHLELLTLDDNPISDLSPLAKLVNLKYISLSGIRSITDISVLAHLIQLERLHLDGLPISDPSPLANLINLKTLWIQHTLVTDLTPLQRLNLTNFRYDEVCEIPPLLPSTRERIETRTFPSIFQAWDRVVGLDHLTWEQRTILHDLYWSTNFENIEWDLTPTEPTPGLSIQLAGNLEHALEHAREVRQRWLNQNPNMIFLREIRFHENPLYKGFPPDSDFWLRDQNGEIIRRRSGNILINFLKPEVQDLLALRLIALAQCGLYDGVFIDGFGPDGTTFAARNFHSATDEEIVQAMLNIFRTARSQMRDDFLIIVNGTEFTQPRFADLINGTFIEVGKTYPSGYAVDSLKTFENILSWSEENLREPQITCLQGQGMNIEPPDGPNNLRWMRLFTTLSLTHSNGYVLYTDGKRDFGGGDHDHLWHPFWDADLGRPVGPKAQQYKDIEGLFIREFTNGWAIYNRSGKAQTITLPASAAPVSDRGGASASLKHLLPDLDGEIYLKAKNLADVNGDGEVNVLDLILVANSLGKAAPDPNSDGIVNILDLVFVAQQFSQ